VHARFRQRGFTLLEIILVLVLLTLLLAAGFGGIGASVRGMRSGEAAIERVDKVRTVQEFLRHQISRALPFPYNQPQSQGINQGQLQREIFDGRSNFMRFVAPMPGYLSHGGAYVQTLEFRPSDGGSQLVFTTTLLNGFSLDKGGPTEADTVVLLDHVADGKFSYRGLDAQGQLMSWTDKWADVSATPLMVGIDLTLSTGQIAWPSMAIALQMDATAARPLGSLPR
jgi:general secretion pathway protein J